MMVWTSPCNGRGLTTNKQTDLTKNTGDYLIGIDIRRKLETMILIVNIYDHRAREAGERPARRQNRQNMISLVEGGTVLM